MSVDARSPIHNPPRFKGHPISLWNRLTEPSPALNPPEERQRARLLASALVLLLPIDGLLLIFLHVVATPFFAILADVTFLALMAAYIFTRTPYASIGAGISLLVTTISPIVTIIADPTQVYILIFLADSILFSSLFFSLRLTMILLACELLTLTTLALVGSDMNAISLSILAVFILSESALIVVVNLYRRQNQLRQEAQARVIADSELRYRLIADNATDMIGRHKLDGVFLYVSPACHSLLGYEAQELLNQSPYDYIHPDDLALVRESHKRLLATPITDTTIYRFRRKDGLYIWFESTRKVVRDPQTGTPWEIVTVSRDVSARKAVEDDLRQTNLRLEASRDTFQRLIQQMPIGIQVFDRNGRCTDVNQAHMAIFNLTAREQVVGKFNILVDKLAETVGTQAGYQRALMGETSHVGEVEFDFTQADSRFAATVGRRFLSVSFFPIYDEHHEIVSVVALNQDVTERRQAEQQRLALAVERERVQTLQHLISDTSHDLKTPLATFNSGLYLMKKFISDPERRDHYAEVLQAQVVNLTKILDDMDSMARLDQASEAFAFEPADLNVLMGQIVSEHEALASEKNQQLGFEPGVDVPMMPVDSAKLRRAITNLLTNALNYTQSGGRIATCIFRNDANVFIEISDNGMGIAKDELGRIFERFYRSEASRRSHATGSGLGLAISKKIVEAHGGRIEVESEEGKGSTFRILLSIA